jgi:hypothetical protein
LVAGPTWVPDTKTDWPNDRRSKYNFDSDLTFHRALSIIDIANMDIF